MTGWYPDVQKALFARGWKQNPDLDSTFFDMKWMLKSKDVKHGELLDHQLANHFSKACNITTKVRGMYKGLVGFAGVVAVCMNVRQLTAAARAVIVMGVGRADEPQVCS